MPIAQTNEEISDRELFITGEFAEPVGEPANVPRSLPEIVVTDRPFRDYADEAAGALAAASAELGLYRHGRQLVLIAQDDGHATIEPVTANVLSLLLSRAANFYRVVSSSVRAHVRPPAEVINNLLTRRDLDIPVVKGITEVPILRTDGTVLATRGYDPAAALYYAPAADMTEISTSAVPDAPAVERAMAVIDDVLCDFPFEDEASRANALAFLLTPVVRPLTGCVPMALINGTNPGTGKGLLASVVSIVAAGVEASVEAVPANDDEFRKKITSALKAGKTLIVWDNVRGLLRSAALECALTTSVWSDRILCTNENATLPQRATWAASGNNVSLGTDMARRCYEIRLISKSARPWETTGFRHPELLSWVRERRGDLLAALLTVASAWFVNGCPAADVRPLGSFEAWTRIVGGILQNAGVKGFLGNLQLMYAQTDDEETEWEAFLNALLDTFGGKVFTVAQLSQAMSGSPEYRQNVLAATMPASLTCSPASTLKWRIGKALAARRGTKFGPDGLYLSQSGVDPHSKAARWKICPDRSAELKIVA